MKNFLTVFILIAVLFSAYCKSNMAVTGDCVAIEKSVKNCHEKPVQKNPCLCVKDKSESFQKSQSLFNLHLEFIVSIHSIISTQPDKFSIDKVLLQTLQRNNPPDISLQTIRLLI